jgi:hypothetical protein
LPLRPLRPLRGDMTEFLPLFMAMLIGFAIKVAVDRALLRRREPVERVDLESIVGKVVATKLPRPYPGETPDEYTARMGMAYPKRAPSPYCVWSELRGSWVERVAASYVCVTPLESETVEAFCERREAAGVYLPRAPMPPDWRWSAKFGSFLSPDRNEV